MILDVAAPNTIDIIANRFFPILFIIGIFFIVVLLIYLVIQLVKKK